VIVWALSMEKTETHKDSTEDSQTNVYELGLLLVPTIAEENVASEVQSIKGLMEKYEGSFISEDFPKLQPLAYTMIKPIGSKRHRHDKGYFGWVKYEIPTEAITEIKRALDKNENILRYLLIETVRENTMVTQKMVFKPTDAQKGEGEEEVKEPVSEEELDKTIDNLVV
jgi:ribosomal protein S6